MTGDNSQSEGKNDAPQGHVEQNPSIPERDGLDDKQLNDVAGGGWPYYVPPAPTVSPIL